MCKIIVIYLFTCIVICMGLPRDQEPGSGEKNESKEDKYELDSRQDFNRTSEKEKELKLLRKAKKLKENNYRRAHESILPAKKNESYRRQFEDLINSSNEKSKLNDMSRKEVEEVEVTDFFADDNGNEEKDDDLEVEEIEVVIERIADDNDDKDGDNNTNEYLTVSQDATAHSSEDPHKDLREKVSTDATNESKDQEQPLQDVNIDEEERMAQDSSKDVEMDGHMGPLAGPKVIESHPVSHFSELLIPRYRNTLTRNGVMVSPAVYTVQTSSPIIDHATTRNWIPNRRILSDIYGRSNSNNFGRSDKTPKSIDDYKDYDGNAYIYSPARSLFASRQVDNRMQILSKFAEGSLQPQLINMQPLRENFHPGTYFSQPQRLYPNSYGSIFRINR